MKKLIILMISFLVVDSVSAISPGLKRKCRKVRAIESGEIYKARASEHIEDDRKFSTSFITRDGTDSPDFDCLKAYNRKGKKIHTMGVYARNEPSYSSRFYGGTGCGDGKHPDDIAAQAIRGTGKPAIFIKVKRRLCVRIPDANVCYNSTGC